MRLKFLSQIISVIFLFLLLAEIVSASGSDDEYEVVKTTPTMEEMWEIIQQQQKTIEQLQQKLGQTDQGVEATAKTTKSGPPDTSRTDNTHISGYGELHYNKTEAGNDEIDFHRFVLKFSHDFTDSIHFVSELELEHALSDANQGEVELEEAFIAIDLTDHHQLVTGIDILPLGLINTKHKPNTFYGVERNEVETRIIPSTWFEAGVGFNGKIAQGIDYDVFLHSGLSTTTNIRSGRQKVGQANADHPAGTARLRYKKIPGLELAASIHYESDIEAGAGVGANEATLFTTHIDYKHNSGFGFRALWGGWRMDRDLATDGKDADGWYIEPAYRFKVGSNELGIFARYENMDRGTATTALREERWVTGLNYWPHPNLAFKLDFKTIEDDDANTSTETLALGIGYRF
jgi:hypothetical protein